MLLHITVMEHYQGNYVQSSLLTLYSLLTFRSLSVSRYLYQNSLKSLQETDL